MSISEFDNQQYSTQQVIVPLGVGIATNTNPSLSPLAGALAQDVTSPGSLYVGTGSTWQTSSASSAPVTITGFNMTNSGAPPQPTLTNCAVVLQNLGSGTYAQTVLTLVLNQQITSTGAGTYIWTSANGLLPVQFLPVFPITFPAIMLQGSNQISYTMTVGTTGQLILTVNIASSPTVMTFTEISGVYI